MSDFPLQGAFGIVIMLAGTFFGLMAWSRARGRLGQPVAIIGGSLLIGAWVAKPDLYETGKERAGDVLDWAVNLGR